MGGNHDLDGLFQQTLVAVRPQLELLEKLTRDELNFYEPSDRCRPAFLPVDQDGSWMLAAYPPKPGAAPKFRIRVATLVEENAINLRDAFGRTGIACEITTKTQPFGRSGEATRYRSVWRVDLPPEVWPAITPAQVRVLRQVHKEIRFFGVLNLITGWFWHGTQPGTAAPRWDSTDEGGFQLSTPVLVESLCIERAFETVGIQFIVRDVGSRRCIQLLPLFVEEILRTPSLAWRARECLLGLAQRHRAMSPAPGDTGNHERDVAATNETYIGRRNNLFEAAAG